MGEALAERGIAVGWQTALSGMSLNGPGVDVLLAGSNGSQRPVEEQRFDYVFGADGIQSAVRTGAGISFTGYTHKRDWSIADVELTDWFTEPKAAHLFFCGAGDVAFAIAIGPLQYRVIANTPEPLQHLKGGFDVKRLLRTDVFKISIKQASTYQAARAFLGGDAAHVHSPVGGRGMNLGIEDAVAFVQRLSSGNLAGYTAERRPIGRRWIRQSERLLSMGELQTPGLVALRNLAFRIVGHIPVLQRPMLERAAGLVE